MKITQFKVVVHLKRCTKITKAIQLPQVQVFLLVDYKILQQQFTLHPQLNFNLIFGQIFS